MTDFITLVRGDDTDFIDDQYIVVNFDTPLDFTGFQASFTMCDITLTFPDISDKFLNIVLNKEFTSKLKKGKQYGELKLIDTKGRVRTVTSVIPILVIDLVKSSPTYVNNSLTVTTCVNEETINIKFETAGISGTEANRLREECGRYATEAKTSAAQAETSRVKAEEALNTIDTKCEAAAEQATKNAEAFAKQAEASATNASQSETSCKNYANILKEAAEENVKVKVLQIQERLDNGVIYVANSHTDSQVPKIKIVTDMTPAEYKALQDANQLDPMTLYFVYENASTPKYTVEEPTTEPTEETNETTESEGE